MSLTYRGNDGRDEREKNYVFNGIWRNSEKGTSSEFRDSENAMCACETRDSLNRVDNMEPLLDAFFSVVPREEDEIAWKKFGLDLCNLALRILRAVEHTDNFQSHLSKLLPSIRVICSRSGNIWRQVLRPLLNILANKKMDFVHLKGTVKELKTILKYAERSEMAMFTRENLHLLRGFYKLTFHGGDFLLQMDILEIVFVCAAGDKRLAEAVLAPPSPTTRQLLQTLNFLDFEKDSRIFLNSFNASLGARKRVFSINCNLVYFGNLSLSAPLGMDGIWVDVNRDSRRLTIFCSDFLSNSDRGQCIMLQLPLSGIEKLKLEFGVLSGGECYCITIEIRSLTDMYEFAKGHTMVCTAPSTKNPRDAVADFARVAEELSAEIRERAEEGKKLPPHQPTIFQREKTGYCDIDMCQAEKRKPSCTSPVVFTTGSIDKNGRKRMRKRNRMSRTSPLILPKEAKEKIRTQQGKTGRDEANVKPASLIKNNHFQVHRFSSSPTENPSSSLSNTYNTNDRSQRIIKVKRNKLSNESIPKVERQRLLQDVICEREEARREKGGMEESPEEYRRRRGLTTVARICEDFILTDEFEVEESGNVETNAPKRDAENTRSTARGRRVSKEKSRENICLSAKRKRSEVEERWKTSLLDPNGYAYRRWLRPTTSERSNFWLKKLQDPHITVSKPETDVFHFTEEGGLSDDSNIFLKDIPAKERKVCRASERERRKHKDRKTHAKAGEKGRPIEIRITGSISEREPRGNSKDGARHKQKTGQVESNRRIGMATYKRAIAPRDEVLGDLCREPDRAPTFLDNLSLNDESEKGEKSIGGQMETQTVAPFPTKTNILSSGKNGPTPAPPLHQSKHVPRKGWLKELEDIAKSVCSAFEKLMEDIGEGEGRRVRKYAQEIQGRMRALTQEEDEETVNRSTRFELCIQYFFQGCSAALDSNQDLQVEMEKRVEDMANLNGRERYVEEEVRAFVGKLKEIIGEQAEAAFNKQINDARIHQFQHLLSSDLSKAFHSHSQHFF